MKLRQRILLGYLAPFLLLLAVMGAVYVDARTADQKNVELDETAPFLEDVVVAADSLVRMQRASFAYVLTNGKAYGNGSGYPKKIYEASASRFQETMNKLEPLGERVGQQDALRRMATIGDNIAQVTHHYMELVDAGREKEAVAEARRGESIRLSSQIDPLIDSIVKDETARRNRQRTEVGELIDKIQNTVEIGTLSAIALTVILGLSIATVVSRSITSSAAQLSSASSEIAATIAQHERTASQQAAAVTQTSATIAQLSASSRQSAEQAANSATLAERAASTTAEGSDSTMQVVAAMGRLREKIGAMADQTLHLSEQTGQIGNIATLVKDLSGQINMLALNAAVEAARAGEHGKGFAVVASEIRKLADQSKKSAEQTAMLVTDIQKATNSSIMITEEGSRTVTDVTQLVQKVAEIFNNLANVAGRVNENSQQMMLNTKQQSIAFAQVADAANSIAAGSKETAAGISQTKVGVQNLNEVAENLKAIA